MVGLKIGTTIFDVENGRKNVAGNEINGVGNFGDVFEGVKKSAGNRGERSGFATANEFLINFETGAGLVRARFFSLGSGDDGAVFFGNIQLIHQ